MHLQTLDYALLMLYLVLMAGVSGFFGWFVKDAAAFLKGGNTIPWYIAGTSNFMSMFSTFVFVAYAGIAYEHGLVAVTVFWSTLPACLIAGVFLARRWRRADLTTPVEYLEKRFNLGVRQVFSWMGLLMRFLDNAVRLYATGLFLATVTPLSLGEAILISGTLITAFTMIGGLWGVVVLDTVQFIVLFFATLILVPIALDAAGGLAGISAASAGHLNWFEGPKGAPLWLLVYYLMITLKYNANWAFIQRLFSVRDEKESRKVAFGSAMLFLVSPLIFLLPAIAARAIVPDLEDPEQAYIAVCSMLLPVGMMGLMVGSMFAATMSALNSEFNVMAGVLTNDVYKRFIKPEANDIHLLWVARSCTIAVGSFVTFGALFVGSFGGAFEANKLFTGIFAIPLAVPLLLGLLWKRPTALGATATVILGAAFALALNLGGWLSWEVSTLLAMVFCVLVLALVRRPGGPNPDQKERVRAFFQEIETPLPAERIPQIDPRFGRALGGLFGFAFIVSGVFFLLSGGFAFTEVSGKLALGVGIACGAGGALLLRHSKRA